MPEGPRQTRKTTSAKILRQALQVAASYAGQMVSIERNRLNWTQQQVADEVRVPQPYVSDLELGRPARISDPNLDSIWSTLAVDNDMALSFVKWWRDNGG